MKDLIISKVKAAAVAIANPAAYRKAIVGAVAGTAAVLAGTVDELTELTTQSVAEAGQYGGLVGLVVYIVGNKVEKVATTASEIVDELKRRL